MEMWNIYKTEYFQLVFKMKFEGKYMEADNESFRLR